MIEKNGYLLDNCIAAANRYDESPITSGPHVLAWDCSGDYKSRNLVKPYHILTDFFPNGKRLDNLALYSILPRFSWNMILGKKKKKKNGPLKDKKKICAKAISKNYIQFQFIPAIILTIYLLVF